MSSTSKTWRARCRTAPLITTLPGSAAPSSRAARFSVSLTRSGYSGDTATIPEAMPMRTRNSPSSAMPSTISSAARMARSASPSW
jgi:hypothetical protein